MMQYRSNYPNHVHLMHVVASKHLYLLADGRLKSQDKPIENKLATVGESKKTVLVHMVIADHTSGAMYGESYSCRDALDPVGFLQRAWSEKEHSFFCGLPEMLSVPKAVDDLWPGIGQYVAANDVKKWNPTSGFQSGVIHPKLWEKEISLWGLYGELPEHRDLSALSRFCQTRCNENEPKRRQYWFTEVPSRPPTRFPHA
jgi:hypothetical protein